MKRDRGPMPVAAALVSNASPATTSPMVARESDGTLVIRLPPPPPPAAPDELLPFPFGNLERNAARALIHDGHLPVAKIGRKFYARRSDVLALVERLSAVPGRAKAPKRESADEAYLRLVGQR